MLLIHVLPSHNYFISISKIDFEKQIFFIGNRNLKYTFFGNINQNIGSLNDVSSDKTPEKVDASWILNKSLVSWTPTKYLCVRVCDLLHKNIHHCVTMWYLRICCCENVLSHCTVVEKSKNMSWGNIWIWMIYHCIINVYIRLYTYLKYFFEIRDTFDKIEKIKSCSQNSFIIILNSINIT